jgi:signal transduction histidine kinase/CheY-like chemotaxis protein
MAPFPSEAFQDHDTLKQLLATCYQEREQSQVALEDAQAEVAQLSRANARLECELAQEKRQHSELICQFARCHAELLELKNQPHQPSALLPRDEDEATAHVAEELQAAVEELQVTAEELESANAALRMTNEDLERRVRERTAEMDRARTAAENANRDKSRFLAAASHDLRQPLNAISLLVGSLQGEITGRRGQTILDRVRDSLQATINLLNALLDLSKLDAGAVEAHPGPVAMDDLLRRLFADYAGPAAAKGLDLRMVPSCGTLWTDDILLERILRNLVENALRYTPRGRVIVGGRRRGAALRIDVLDTGPGIPREQIGTIFNEFCQLENSERSRQSGHGLGLAIVRRTAELLHHPLEVRSVPGCGSRFSITVPLVATPGQASQPHDVVSPVQRPVQHACAVLLVEDDPLVAEAMQWALEDLGCTVRLAATVTEAESLLNAFVPHLMITDYRLPGNQDGFAAIAAIRRRVGHEIPVCLITGDVTREVSMAAEQAGVRWLTKPIKPDDLKYLVERAFSSI